MTPMNKFERHSKAMKISRRFGPGDYRDFLCKVTIELDIDGILQLIGNRAMGNKSKRSRLLSGLIEGEIQVGGEIKDGQDDKGAAGSRDETASGV